MIGFPSRPPTDFRKDLAKPKPGHVVRYDAGMHSYKVRCQKLSALGFLTQADHYQDYEFESADSLEIFAAQLAAKGFPEPSSKRWIMPGAIIWIEQYR